MNASKSFVLPKDIDSLTNLVDKSTVVNLYNQALFNIMKIDL